MTTTTSAAVPDSTLPAQQARPERPNKRSLENYAACAALELTFWAEHPKTHRLWAVDDAHRMHVVRLDRKNAVAIHECNKYELLDAGIHDPCPNKSQTAEFDLVAVRAMFGGTPLPRPNRTARKAAANKAGLHSVPSTPVDKPVDTPAPPRKSAAPRTVAPPVARTMTVEAAVAQIEHDPDWLGDIPVASLALTLQNKAVARKYGTKIRAELKKRGPELLKGKA